MQLRKIGKSNDGVVGIIVAVLLIGLLVSIISIVQLYYVPAWMEEREAEHIEQVLTQFSELKSAIDTQSATQQKYTPISTSITLGSKELPFLMSLRAFGNLEIIEEDCIITFANGSIEKKYELGIIKYTSANAYYIPEEKQSFVYESGAVLTGQTSGASISIKPAFNPISFPNFEIIFNIVNISAVGGKVSWGGYDTIGIQTEFNESINIIYNETEYINISTSYPEAWSIFIDSSLKKEGLDYKNNYIIDIIDETLVIQFIKYPLPNVNLTEIRFFAQIGPGWIE
jgi:hypothetical protein